MLSLIIPCHNRLELLKQLVNSIPICYDIEVILVDDYSTEDLTKIDLSVFPNHKYIQNDTSNRFAGSARNIGIENSSGEYLFFADSDDLVISDEFVKCLDMIKNEKPDILFANTTSFYDSDNSLGTRHIRSNWLVNRVLNGANQSVLVRFATPWAKFIRKDFVEKHKIRFENQSVSNDVVFAALLLVNQPVIQVCDNVVYSIRQGNQALTNDYSVESTVTRLQALLRYNMILSDNGLRYLMAPAMPFLVRLVRKNSIKVIYWAIFFLTNRQPVFFTWWTLKNSLIRYLSKSV